MSKDMEGKDETIMDTESKVLWYPDSKRNTQMDKFRIQVNSDYGLNLANYNDLYQWSVDSYPEFWAEVWRFCGVVSSKPYEEVVDVSKRISDVPEWFKGARLNFAENLLKHANQDKVALYAGSPNYGPRAGSGPPPHLVRPPEQYQRAFSVFFHIYVDFSSTTRGALEQIQNLVSLNGIYTSQYQSPFRSRFFPFAFWVKIYLQMRICRQR
uniref:Acetyl-coenzyme A synthetase N-terminal domain-containing protein n=1 Tax=Poecilia mexicana TaxID=48701 RepID=A0A3B3YSD9_9TELE